MLRGRIVFSQLKVSAFTPHELTRLALRAVREKRSDVGLWKAVAMRARNIVDQMSPYDMSVIVFGLGVMGYRDKDLLDKTSSAVIPALPAMSMNDISHLLAGFARVEVRNDLLFDLASREIGRKLPTCRSISEIANILHAFTSLGYEHPLLFEALAKRTVFLLPFAQTSQGSTPHDIAKLVESFSLVKSEIGSEKSFAILSSEICKRIEEFPIPAVARIANSFAKRNLLAANRFMTELILDESFRRRNEFDPKSTALLLNAVSKSDSPKQTLLFDFFATDLCKRGVEKFDLQAITLLASAFCKNKGPDVPRLFHLIGDRVATLSDQLNAKQVAALAKAFATVGCRHGPLLFNLPNHVEQLIGSMSLPEIASVMNGYAKLGIRNDVILDCTPQRVEALLADYQQVPDLEQKETEIFALTTISKVGKGGTEKARLNAAVDILESYATLMINQKALIPKLVEYISSNSHLLAETHLVETVPKSLNTLMAKCPDALFKRIAESAENKWDKLDDKQINEIQVLKSAHAQQSFISC